MSFVKNISLARMIDDYLPRGGGSPTIPTKLPDEVREMAGWVVPVCVVGVVFLLVVVVRSGLFDTDISKTYVSVAKNVMSTTLMENQAIKTNWGMV